MDTIPVYRLREEGGKLALSFAGRVLFTIEADNKVFARQLLANLENEKKGAR